MVSAEHSALEIAAMTGADLDEVCALGGGEGHRSPARQLLARELELEWAHLEVGRRPKSAAILAYCNYWRVADELQLHDLAVHPDHRRRGIGGRFVVHLVSVARREARRLTLEVRRSNTPARALYCRSGLLEVGVRPGYYDDGAEDAILMTLEG